MKRRFLLLAAGLTSVPVAAVAHPHIFAEARMEIVEGPNGTIQEVRNIWRFDEMFSASVVMDYDKNSDLKLDKDELAEIGNTVLESLAEYSYYTFITADSKPVAFGKPEAIHVDYRDNQILMFFSVKPTKPLAIKGKLSFGAWDPTMYTAIDFAKDADLATEGKDLNACKHHVVRPDPDEVLAQNQSTLTDAFFNDPTGTDMTKMFATRLEVTC
ncbi:DUF1007 family protein [Rhizobium oryzihabitans]|jgi:ABC-type uncharacterized transport system substrate-binding protein|uniref:DUF1007 family protein n=1 Tax=Rhizobium oryzihabitans TaxID=2267833 RepID=A0A7L5BPW3_9HYPH|nr:MULTISPECIES: DUF1007 family protein [Rhizobium]EGP56039.1 hypothetical protein Agau_L101621 [Agrobacterium tumefaciens F2]MCW0982349.1 DUF1007 family protein [Agrobacterium sp. BT-220-3]QCM13174.1 DUF1007 family protein [Agrobacterium tumefaciens]CUX47770.1 conserved exported hypothetical protein [Agrobacterium genomosp. 5 str. CFBP 6626]HCD82532.1 DUF1007 domain-containing protein [Agrobacterium sp.]